jgi:putative ABC transport system substrate-binding protein
MKKTVFAAMALAAAMALSAACTTGVPAEETTGGAVKKIGIVQIVAHPALDAARDGFIAAREENGFDDTKVSLDINDAMNDMSNLSTISERFVNDNVDLVLAIATPSAQAMAAKSTTIPIVATAVTSFEDAGLVDSDEAPGGNVTGTSDLNPVAAQIALIKQFAPEAATVGFIYNAGESNSVLQINIAKAEAEALGLEWTEVTVAGSADVQQAAQSLVERCDIIYVPTDNTVASAMTTVASIATEAGIPTICGESNLVTQGGLVTMGVNYFDLGREAGLMAIEILNGANPAEMPVRFAANSSEVVINGATAEELGFEVPEEFKEFVIFPEE